MYACAKPHRKFFRRGPRRSSSRRKNARRSLCSSFLRNYRAALSFLLRGAASPRFLFFYRFFLEPPDAVFALHDSRVQISWRKLAIPSRLALLTGFESAGRRHRRRKANFATPRATARGVCMYACAKPHRKFFRRGPRRSSSRRKNASRSLCSSFLRNYRTALSFLLRAAASPRFLSFYRFFLEPPDAVIPHKTCVLRGPRFLPHKTCVLRGPR